MKHLAMRISRLTGLGGAAFICVVGCSPGAPRADGLAATYEVVVPQDRYAEVNGIRLHYLDWGGDGDLFLFVPGLSHTAHTYDAVAPAFTDRYHVVAVTRREHGASSKPGTPIDLEILADDLADFLTLLTDQPAIIAGQSYAGVEMPRLAKTHPEKVRALVFLDAVYDWPGLLEDGPPFPGYYVANPSYESYEALESWFGALYPEIWNDAAKVHLISQTRLAADGTIRWNVPVGGPLWNQFTEVYRPWTSSEYEGLEMPVLSIQVEQGGFMAANLERAGSSQAVIDTARTWANELDNVLKRRGREIGRASCRERV